MRITIEGSVVYKSVFAHAFTLRALLLVAVLLCLSAAAHAQQQQTPSFSTVNIAPDADRVRINAEGDALEMRVEVSDETGHVVFESGPVSGQQLDWRMTDAQGERVAPGTYLVTVTFRTAAGKLRKRVEQVTVAEDEKAGEQAAVTPTPYTVQANITGSGTNGKIARFTGATTIGNSAITESAGKIGIGTASPTSKLTVTGAADNKPAILSTNNAAGGIGVKGTSTNATGIGVWGTHTATTGTTPGVKGETNSTDPHADAVLGVLTSPYSQAFAAGVHGISQGGVYSIGVFGEHKSNLGTGVYGLAPDGTGVYGYGTRGVWGQSSTSTSYAGYFSGRAHVSGNLEIEDKVGIGTDAPKAKLHVTGGDIFIAQPNSLIITSPNGSCWQLRVSDAGALFAASVTCP